MTNITYIGQNEEFTPASYISGGGFNYGSWEDKFPFNLIVPYIVSKNGTTKERIQINDYSKLLNGDPADITSGDYNVMVRFPKIFVKIEQKVGDTLEIKFAEEAIDATYIPIANQKGIDVEDNFYLGAYRCGITRDSETSDLKLASISDSEIGGTFSDYSFLEEFTSSNGTGYQMQHYHSVTIIQALFMLMFRSTSSTLTTGVTGGSGTSGYGNTLGLFGISGDRVKCFGMEDYWGGNMPSVVTDVYTRGFDVIDIYTRSVDGTYAIAGYSQVIPDSNERVRNVLGNTLGGFFPTVTGATSTTYFCDSTTIYGSGGQIMLHGSDGIFANNMFYDSELDTDENQSVRLSYL